MPVSYYISLNKINVPVGKKVVDLSGNFSILYILFLKGCSLKKMKDTFLTCLKRVPNGISL